MCQQRATRPVHLSILGLLLAVVTTACGTAQAAAPPETGVAGERVVVGGVDPTALLSLVASSAGPGWEVVGAGRPTRVSLAEIGRTDADRAAHYARAGFEVGGRLSLARGEQDRIAVMVDRFPHAAAAREVGDWLARTSGVTMEDEVSLLGVTAEGMVVLDDLVVRVIAVGAEEPDGDAVRSLLAAARRVTTP